MDVGIVEVTNYSFIKIDFWISLIYLFDGSYASPTIAKITFESFSEALEKASISKPKPLYFLIKPKNRTIFLSLGQDNALRAFSCEMAVVNCLLWDETPSKWADQVYR